LVNADIRAPLHVEATTDVILAGMRGSRMGGADKGLQNFNNVSSIWLKPWRASAWKDVQLILNLLPSP
jgi:molybdopterin-guanine dinucleotide biosynthesis protein A